MPKLKLTKKVIDDAQPQAADHIIWDTEVPGLGLKVTPTGRKIFVCFFRTLDGTQRKPKVGDFGGVTLDQARDIARGMLGEVRAGGDPSATRRSSREAPTVADACARFLDEHAKMKKPKTEEMYRQLVKAYILPALGARKVGSIKHEDVTRVVYALGKKHPIAANRLRATLSKLFALTEKWGMRPNHSNPCVHVERNREVKRHRDLTEAELERLAKVLADAEGTDPKVMLNPRAIAAIRLLMFTGCRRNEVLHLRWSEVDLERGILRLGDSKTGAKVIHLNVAAKEVIEAQAKVAKNPYVFPSDRREGKALADIKRVWELVRERAGIDGDGAMRLHDLRHHYASTAAAAGLSLPLIGKLLGHKTASTTQRYASLADDPARRASEQVGRLIAGSISAEVSP